MNKYYNILNKVNNIYINKYIFSPSIINNQEFSKKNIILLIDIEINNLIEKIYKKKKYVENLNINKLDILKMRRKHINSFFAKKAFLYYKFNKYIKKKMNWKNRKLFRSRNRLNFYSRKYKKDLYNKDKKVHLDINTFLYKKYYFIEKQLKLRNKNIIIKNKYNNNIIDNNINLIYNTAHKNVKKLKEIIKLRNYINNYSNILKFNDINYIFSIIKKSDIKNNILLKWNNYVESLESNIKLKFKNKIKLINKQDISIKKKIIIYYLI